MSNMVVNTNVLALNAHRNLSSIGVAQAKASQRLSSGLKINSAADDAAGLAISEKMRAQIRGLDMAAKNAQDGISLLQTAEGSIQEINNMVQRIRELTVQAANDTNTTEDRAKIADEISQLTTEITDMAGRTEFNTKKLTTGLFASSSISLQVGANAGQQISFNIGEMTATALGIDGISASIKSSTTASDISDLTDTIDTALKTVADQRAALGAVQNRVEYTINNLKTSSENLAASESRIRDTDMAKEMMNLTKANVLQQAATSMLAQANQAPQSILKLLG